MCLLPSVRFALRYYDRCQHYFGRTEENTKRAGEEKGGRDELQGGKGKVQSLSFLHEFQALFFRLLEGDGEVGDHLEKHS